MISLKPSSLASDSQYKNIDKINKLLSLIDPATCGPIRNTNDNIAKMMNSNGRAFFCLRKKKDKQYREVMNKITPLLDYESDIQYINFFSNIYEFDDPKSFSIAIDLLQYDYEPDPVPGSDVQVAPVRQYVLNQLVLPHVYSINGDIIQAGSMEYKELMMKYHVYMSTEEFHQYVRELWEKGAIVLKSQVDD